MATPTYQHLIGMLSKAESEAAGGSLSVAELLSCKFSHRFPHVQIGRPGRFLETVRRIAGPIRRERLKGTARRSYLKRHWAPRTRNTTSFGECVSILAPIAISSLGLVCFKRNCSIQPMYMYLCKPY